MNTGTAIVVAVVILGAMGIGVYMVTKPPPRRTSGQMIGDGVGSLVGGILGAAGVS